ncbi:pantothenate kinase, type III [Thiovulum sp. ES]|nr:pantothenate kinase, type III [Thiovulum sp. ES]
MRKFFTSLSLADIGNTNAKIWRDGKLEIVSLSDFSAEKIREQIFYISVNPKFAKVLNSLQNWIDIESFAEIDTNYKTLGADRKLAIFGLENGILIDMGSAVTIDIMKNGKHLGGYILFGKSYLIQSFKEKIPHLNFGKNQLSDEVVPQNSEDALLSGFYHQLVSFLRDLEKKHKLKLFFTGGDSLDMLQYFPKAKFNKNIIFENMIKIVEQNY